jgi:hypothetical protein
MRNNGQLKGARSALKAAVAAAVELTDKIDRGRHIDRDYALGQTFGIPCSCRYGLR